MIRTLVWFLFFSCIQVQWFFVEAFSPKIEVWEPAFSQNAERSTINYQFLSQVSQRWRVCVSIPHLKDAYWLAVNYGLIDQAKKMGVGIRIFSAGGYDQLAVQKRQVREALEMGYDALILSGISSTGLNEEIAMWKAKENL